MNKPEYYITDGTNYIKQNVNGQFKTVSNYAVADSWDSAQVAKAILYNSVPRVWRNTFYVVKYEEGNMIKWSLSGDEKEEKKSEIATVNKSNKSYKLDLYSFENDSEIQSIVSSLAEFNDILRETENLHLKLQEELNTLECMLEDLKHYQLKKKLGTVDSYKFKKLSDKIILRRVSVKNQLEILYKINQYRPTIKEPIKEICETIKSVKNRKYKPRVLVDLFENDNLDIEVVV